MGFFSTIGDIFAAAAPIVGGPIGAALGIGGGLLGGDGEEPAAAAVPKQVLQASGALGNIQGSKLITPGPRPAGEIFEEVRREGVSKIVSMNGSLRRRTIVETFNPVTGAVTKRETLKGAPAVMQSDVAAANRLNRQLARLKKKQPVRLVHKSELSTLKDEVVASALRKARDPCPPKCP